MSAVLQSSLAYMITSGGGGGDGQADGGALGAAPRSGIAGVSMMNVQLLSSFRSITLHIQSSKAEREFIGELCSPIHFSRRWA